MGEHSCWVRYVKNFFPDCAKKRSFKGYETIYAIFRMLPW